MIKYYLYFNYDLNYIFVFRDSVVKYDRRCYTFQTLNLNQLASRKDSKPIG